MYMHLHSCGGIQYKNSAVVHNCSARQNGNENIASK